MASGAVSPSGPSEASRKVLVSRVKHRSAQAGKSAVLPGNSLNSLKTYGCEIPARRAVRSVEVPW